MSINQPRIERLRRLLRLRDVEARRAAMHLAEAQDLHGKLRILQDRSVEIAAALAPQCGELHAVDLQGADLSLQLRFAAGLEQVRRQAVTEADLAGCKAGAAMADLQAAQRRQQATDELLSKGMREAEREAETHSASLLARKLKSHW